MSLQDAKKEVLTYLFELYKENNHPHRDISEIAQKHNIDTRELGKYLVDHGFVKNPQYGQNSFRCEITLDGINEIDYSYVREKTDEVIQALGDSGTRTNIIEIIEDYQKAFDIAKYLESRSFIKATQYGPGRIVTELSLDGRDYYEKNKPEWLS